MPAHLRKLALPAFHGDILKWSAFWEAFESMVHSQPIADVLKMNYLHGLLRDEPARAAAGLALIGFNYAVAVDILQRRCGNPDVVRHALHTAMKNLPHACTHIHDLRHVYEEVEKICRQLSDMHEDINHPQMVTVIESKFPMNILRELYNIKGSVPVWNTTILLKELGNLIKRD